MIDSVASLLAILAVQLVCRAPIRPPLLPAVSRTYLRADPATAWVRALLKIRDHPGSRSPSRISGPWCGVTIAHLVGMSDGGLGVGRC